MSGDRRVRVLVWHHAQGHGDRLAVLYDRVSAELAGVPGLLGNELLRSVADPDGFLIMSEWESMAAFDKWCATPGHRVTGPLRAFRAVNARSRAYETYEVVDEHAYLAD